MRADNAAHCLICRSRKFSLLYDSTLLLCQNCGFVTANLQVDPDFLKEIYSENYFKGEEYENYLRDRGIFRLNFRKRINRAGLSGQEKVLEIGAAYGFFGELLREIYPNLDYVGIDIAEEPVRYGREELGLTLKVQDYLDYQPKNKLNLIFMWDVIEHLQHPDKILQKAATELSPGGRILLTTGDIGSWLAKRQGARWRMIHPPSHLHYFNPGSISMLLNNYGFEVVKISYPPVWRNLKQIAYSLFLLNRKASFYRNTLYRLTPDIAFPFNTFDIMYVEARKR